MSASANKKLMQDIFAAAASPDPAARDRGLFTESLADDAKWIVTGQYSWSRTFSGKQAILNDLHAYVRTRLVDRTRTVAHRFIADGDIVVVEAKGDNVTPEGVRYNKPGLQAHIQYLASMTTGVDQKIGRDAIDRYQALKKELDALKAQADALGL